MNTHELDRLVPRRSQRAARTRIVGCVCAAILTTASCGQQAPSGGGPSSADRARTADEKAATSSLRTAMKRSGGFVPGKEGCYAAGLVHRLGVERLVELGLLDEHHKATKKTDNDVSMRKRDATTFADVILHCVSWRLLAMYAIDDTPDLHSKYDRRCTATITKGDVRGLFVAVYSGETPDDDLPPMYKKLQRAGCGFEGDD